MKWILQSVGVAWAVVSDVKLKHLKAIDVVRLDEVLAKALGGEADTAREEYVDLFRHLAFRSVQSAENVPLALPRSRRRKARSPALAPAAGCASRSQARGGAEPPGSAGSGTQPAGNVPCLYDYVVVGGGSSGCSFAKAMSDAGYKVLVIERGPTRVEHNSTHDIWGTGSTLADKKIVQPVLTASGIVSHVGAVLGGGSAVSFAIQIEETLEFMQHLLPLKNAHLFQRAREWIRTRAVSYMPLAQPYSRTLFDAITSLEGGRGQPAAQPKPSAEIVEGGTWNAASLFNASEDFFRFSADTFLANAFDPQPSTLDVLVETLAESILFDAVRPDDKTAPVARCVLVRATRDSDITDMKTDLHTQRLVPICARKEIVLAAGAIMTPVLLAKSGIGNAEQMRELKINRPLLVNDAIGTRLIDRIFIPMTGFLKHPLPVPQISGLISYQNINSTWIVLEEATGTEVIQTLLYGTHLLVSPSLRHTLLVDAGFSILDDCSRRENNLACEMIKPFNVCLRRLSTIWAFLPDPKSRGFVKVSRDGVITAEPNYLSHPEDVAAAANGVYALTKVMKYEGMTEIMESNEQGSCSSTLHHTLSRVLGSPGARAMLANPFLFFPPKARNQHIATFPAQLPEMTDTSSIVNYVKQFSQSMWHFVGTVPMGEVVDENFYLKGLSNIAVVDGSVLPHLTRINPTNTIMILGRYAALLRLQT